MCKKKRQTQVGLFTQLCRNYVKSALKKVSPAHFCQDRLYPVVGDVHRISPSLHLSIGILKCLERKRKGKTISFSVVREDSQNQQVFKFFCSLLLHISVTLLLMATMRMPPHPTLTFLYILFHEMDSYNQHTYSVFSCLLHVFTPFF